MSLLPVSKSANHRAMLKLFLSRSPRHVNLTGNAHLGQLRRRRIGPKSLVRVADYTSMWIVFAIAGGDSPLVQFEVHLSPGSSKNL